LIEFLCAFGAFCVETLYFKAMSSSISTEPASSLRIGGVVPFTATDYPGLLAAVVFCQGCPWRCVYCHNPHLLSSTAASPLDVVPWDKFSKWLDTRHGLLDGVVFSGGEPLAQGALPAAVAEVKAKGGFRVGLHTGGAYPDRLGELLPDIDWVGLDMKASPSGYERVTGVPHSGDRAFESLDLILKAGVGLECRTTVHAAVTPADELIRLAQTLRDKGIKKWVLQPFRAQGCDNAELLTFNAAVLDDALLAELRTIVPEVMVRK
jgi:pyruvate formate lyase activating enzyme